MLYLPLLRLSILFFSSCPFQVLRNFQLSLKYLQRVGGLGSLLDFFSAEDLFRGTVGVWDVLYRIYETYLHNNAIISCSGHNTPASNGTNGNSTITSENNNYTNIHINRSGNTTPRKCDKLQIDDNEKISNDHDNTTNKNNQNKIKKNMKKDGKINLDNNLSEYYHDHSQLVMTNNPIFLLEKCDSSKNIPDGSDLIINSTLSPNSFLSKNKNKIESFHDHDINIESGDINKSNNTISINDLEFSFNNSLSKLNNNKFIIDNSINKNSNDKKIINNNDSSINSNSNSAKEKNANKSNEVDTNFEISKDNNNDTHDNDIDNNRNNKSSIPILSSTLQTNTNKTSIVPKIDSSNTADLSPSDSIIKEINSSKSNSEERRMQNDLKVNDTESNTDSDIDNDEVDAINSDNNNSHNDNHDKSEFSNDSKMSKISKKPGMIPTLTVLTKNVPHHIIIPPPRSPMVREERSFCSSPLPLPLPRSPTVITTLTPLVLHPTVGSDYSGSKKRLSNDKDRMISLRQTDRMFNVSNDTNSGKDDFHVEGHRGSGKSMGKSSGRNSPLSSPSKSPNHDNTDREINEDSDYEIKDNKKGENERLRSSSVFSLNSEESTSPRSLPSVQSATLSAHSPLV